MTNNILYLLLAIVLALVGVAGDSFIKYATQTKNQIFSKAFLIGLIIYALTAFGWFLVIKHVKLGTLGIFYAVSTVLALFIVSIFYFKESYSKLELIGATLAIISLIILGKRA